MRAVIETPFDKWPFTVRAKTKQTTKRNFMAQATGATEMRLAAIAATEERLQVGGAAHDAFWLVSTDEQIVQDVAHLQEIMAEAAERVCGLRIEADAEIIRYPERWWDEEDEDACRLWHRLLGLLERAKAGEGAPGWVHSRVPETVP
jgi:hypothetical protein